MFGFFIATELPMSDPVPTLPAWRRRQQALPITRERLQILRRALRAAGIAQVDVARRAEVTPTSVSTVLRGRSRSQHVVTVIEQMLAEHRKEAVDG